VLEYQHTPYETFLAQIKAEVDRLIGDGDMEDVDSVDSEEG
jgi:hypothetical protein